MTGIEVVNEVALMIAIIFFGVGCGILGTRRWFLRSERRRDAREIEYREAVRLAAKEDDEREERREVQRRLLSLEEKRK